MESLSHAEKEERIEAIVEKIDGMLTDAHLTELLKLVQGKRRMAKTAGRLLGEKIWDVAQTMVEDNPEVLVTEDKEQEIFEKIRDRITKQLER